MKQYEAEPAQNPDELAERFIAITDDLAFAQTFYPNSKTSAYLNTLAAGFHQSIYKNRKEKSNRFIKFWQTELPILFKTYSGSCCIHSYFSRYFAPSAYFRPGTTIVFRDFFWETVMLI